MVRNRTSPVSLDTGFGPIVCASKPHGWREAMNQIGPVVYHAGQELDKEDEQWKADSRPGMRT